MYYYYVYILQFKTVFILGAYYRTLKHLLARCFGFPDFQSYLQQQQPADNEKTLLWLTELKGEWILVFDSSGPWKHDSK